MPWSHTEHRQKPSLTHFLTHKTAKVAQRKDMYTGRSVFVLHGTLSTWLDAFWLFWQCSLPHSSEISSPSAHFASDKDEIVEVVFGLHSVRTTQPGMEPRAQESSLCYCASETGCCTLLRYSQELLHSSLAYVSKRLEQLTKNSVFPLCTQVLMLPAMMSACVKEKELLIGHN